MCLVDANIVLRYILDDHAELSSRAAEILEHHEAVLPIEVVCEVVYVLQKVYQVAREQIQAQLGNLINERLVSVEKPDVLKQALSIYGAKNLDIVDAFLWAYHVVDQQQVFTFDDKLRKYLDGGTV
jgi:predicted nucleic-acid-binding protein